MFRITLDYTKPAAVKPMKIDLLKDVKPVRVRSRRYTAEGRAWLEKYVKALVDMNFLVPNSDASWQAAPLLVAKRNSKAKFRLATDLRPVNAATIKQAWPMPNLDSEVYDFAGSKFFAVLDFCSGYWQLPVDPESWDACGIVTPKGTYSSTRVLPGLTNATVHFQSTVEPLFAELRDHLKAWLDDFNLHAKTEDELLSVFKRFLQICQEKNLFLSAKKCQLFKKEVTWCGRKISGDGYEMDPYNSEWLKDLSMPKTGGELFQYIHCCRWMSTAIPAFEQRIAPLSNILEQAYERSGRRKKKSIENMELSLLSWGPDHERAFKDLQTSILNFTKLAYPKKGSILCVYTDASYYFWSGVVTQIKEKDLSLPLEEQRHEPLAFLGQKFNATELKWTTYEKEGYAIFKTFKKMDFLMLSDLDVHVFTDHRNLLFVYSPIFLKPDIGSHAVPKILRWALFLSRFTYKIEHVMGEENIFADILTRWLKGYRTEKQSIKRTIRFFVSQPPQILPSTEDENFVWPSQDDIRATQNQYKVNRPKETKLDSSSGLYMLKNNFWIPQEDLDLHLKILVSAHCGMMGHRGAEATESVIRENFFWTTLSQDTCSRNRGSLPLVENLSATVRSLSSRSAPKE